MWKNFSEKQKRMVIFTSAIVLGLLLAFAKQYNGQQAVSKEPVQVMVTALSNLNKPVTVARQGLAEHATSTVVYSDHAGRITEVYVTEGQQAKAGQPLVKIETVSTIQEERAGTQAAENQLSGNDAALKNLERFQKLYEIGAISRKEFEQAKNRFEASRQVPTASPNAVAVPRVITGSVVIEAPVSGVIKGLAVTAGSSVQSGQQLLALGSGQDIEIAVKLAQDDLYFVQLGTKAVVEVTNQTLNGQVYRIYPQVEGNKVTGFLANIKLDSNATGILMPGTQVNVRIDTGTAVSVAAIPKTAVIQDEKGQYFVYLAKNGKAVRHQIGVGEEVGDFIEITSKLPGESMIITSNIEQINNGDDVVITENL